MPSFKEIIEQEMNQIDNYNISMDNFTDDVTDNMVDAAKEKMSSSRKNSVDEWVNNEWRHYTLESVEYDSMYLITKATEGENRVVVIFKLEFTSESDTKTTYDAYYYDYLKLSENNTIICSYAPKSISKSDAAWHRDSFESREQCYRENVLAFGGTVTEFDR